MIELGGPYQPRPIRFLELWEAPPWRLKLYGIAYGRAAPRPELIAAAKKVAEKKLYDQEMTRGSHGVGFLGVHEGKTANIVFLDWWTDENELRHHIYYSPSESPAELEDVTARGWGYCVWDLRVIGFERDAWMETVLDNPSGPDVEAYLQRQLNEDV